MVRKNGSAPMAYSYVRFSSPEQGKGDSVRRQEELRAVWLKKSGAMLDTTISLRDEGVSAFSGRHRENPDRHALAAFLEFVRRGRVPPGSYLVVESLDRLSREHIRPALTLLLNLIEAGIKVVQLLPVETVYDQDVEPMQLLMAIMELSRGHSESRMKAERVGRAWHQKKRTAASDKKPITRRAPAWLRVEGDRFVIDKSKADAIRRIYKMAARGHGIGAIAKRLNAEGVPTVGPADHWPRSYVAKLLTSRAVIGEYVPMTRRGGGVRRPDGDAIPDYFPAVVTDDEWHAARAALVSRRQKGGRPTRRLNIFSGLLHDARDGGTLFQLNKGSQCEGRSGVLLASYRAYNGVKGTRFVSFPLDIFERAVLSRLRELDPREIVPQGGPEAANQVLALTGKRGELQKRIEQVKAKLVDGGNLTSLVEVLRTLEAKAAIADEELEEAQRAAASPLTGAWAECRGILDVLDKSKDEAETRTRLRGTLRRMVDSIWCLFIGKRSMRIAAVQLFFAGGKRRDYIILYKAATGGAVARRLGSCDVRSFAGIAGPKDLDLRRRTDAQRLEGALLNADLAG
ncbi:hypothetical protein AYO40_05070 [Planctomycetaceae bacterium SCGC AG-212-D15]|nr:hypothetical protein AYO40_05070 [Planctomycetaceae bacterium SCGC AG-212-D15]